MNGAEKHVSLQTEIHEWEQRNFGQQDPMKRLIGMAEEMGEFIEFVGNNEEQDSLADVLIFGLNYLSSIDTPITSCLESTSIGGVSIPRFWSKELLAIEFGKTFGKLCHYHLKSDQGIRGDASSNTVMAIRQFGKIWLMIDSYCIEKFKTTAFTIVRSVFDEIVSKRDWANNPGDGVTAKS